jgi:hypothetical protein
MVHCKEGKTMSKIASILAGVGLLYSVGVASAAEPVALDDAQMDQVAAGLFNVLSLNFAAVGQNAQSVSAAGNSLLNVGTISAAGSAATNNASVIQF